MDEEYYPTGTVEFISTGIGWGVRPTFDKGNMESNIGTAMTIIDNVVTTGNHVLSPGLPNPNIQQVLSNEFQQAGFEFTTITGNQDPDH